MSRLFSKLGDVAEFINGAAFKPEDWGEEGKRIIRIQNLNDSTKPYNRTTRVVPERLHVSPGDILVSWSASLGVFEWSGPDIGLLNQHIFRVLPDTSKVDKRYLRHALELALLDMQRHLHGATMMHVNRGEFLATKLFLPSIPEQRRIAAILDQADALRAKRREALAELDQLTQSIFIEMFGEPDTNPKEWPTAPLGKQVSVIGGYAFKSVDYVASGIPLIRIGDVNRGGFYNETACFLPEEFSEEYSRFLVYPGDLLMSLTGTTGKDDYGNIAVLGPERENYLLNQRVACIRPRLNLITREYLANFLGNKKIKERIISRSRGVRQANISNPDILEISLPLPPVETQNEFAKSIDSVRNLKANHLAAAVQSERLFSSLQHRAFRGEL